MSFTELLGNVGFFGAAVMCCLIALSFFSVALIVDKHRRFRAAARQSQLFKPVFGKFLHGGEVRELIEAARVHQTSHVAQVVSAGILEYEGVRQTKGTPQTQFTISNAVRAGNVTNLSNSVVSAVPIDPYIRKYLGFIAQRSACNRT